MKKKLVPFLLVLTVGLGLLLPSLRAEAEGEPSAPENAFCMEAVFHGAETVTAGDTFSVEIFGGRTDPAAAHQMTSFQFTLDYPADQVRLVSLEGNPMFRYVGLLEVNGASACYNTNPMQSVELGDKLLLATAVFEVLPTAVTGDIQVGLTNAEITRPEDQFSSLGTVTPTGDIHIENAPMLSLSEDGTQAELHNNPAGTLVTAVYESGGRMLRCTADQVAENGEPVALTIDRTGGAYVKAFLLNGEGVPACPAAFFQLP